MRNNNMEKDEYVVNDYNIYDLESNYLALLCCILSDMTVEESVEYFNL